MSHLVEKEKAGQRETSWEVKCMAATHSVPAHWGATCPTATNRKAYSPIPPHGDDIWGSRRSSTALPLRPVKGSDVRHKFNPQTCWDAEKLSSGKTSPTSRTLAGSRIACQKKLYNRWQIHFVQLHPKYHHGNESKWHLCGQIWGINILKHSTRQSIPKSA